MQKQIIFNYEEYGSSKELTSADAELLAAARTITPNAYAPYSQFQVGAAARLSNGNIYTGTNQENVSYPVGMCAEQSLMLGITTRFKEFKISSLAISYTNLNGLSDKPISPCGKCRQFLSEFESRMQLPIRIILSGQTGKVYIVNSVSDLLPLSFGSIL